MSEEEESAPESDLDPVGHLDTVSQPDNSVGERDSAAVTGEPNAQRRMTSGPFEIAFESRESISFIGAYNGRPVVFRLAIRAADGRSYEGLTVELALSSLGETLADPWLREVDNIGPKPITWSSDEFKDFRLDSNSFLQITARQHAEFVLTIRRGDEVLSSYRRGIDVLAPDSFATGYPLDAYAIELAALVQTQEPALRPVLERADQLLKSRPDYRGLNGYQSADGGDFDYVDAIVGAIFEAAQATQIVYSNPPSSWELGDTPGQRVRRPGQVLSERVGTCLDTTILMAALIAAVDIFPVIFLAPGHAFVGYWRDSQWRRHPQSWRLTDGRNLVDSGLIVPVETTLLPSQDATFSQALAGGKDGFVKFSDLDDPSEIVESVAIDVAVAHRRGTIPIPVRVPHEDGTVSLIEYKAQELSIDLLVKAIADNASTTAGLQSNDAPKRVKRWMDSLLDLSLRNPLLNYRFPAATSVSLMIPDGFLGRLEDMLQSGATLNLSANTLTDGNGPARLTSRHTLPEMGREIATEYLVAQQTILTSTTSDIFIPRMRRMQSAARSIIDESGSNQLYLALGMVAWMPEGKSDERSAPLILLPVSLKSSNRSREFALEIDPSGQVTPNFSLAERLKNDANLNLTKLVEPDLDDAGIDVPGLISYVREEFHKAGLTDYRVDESCTLGFFDFSTYRLWRDLKENWARFESNSPLVKHLVETPTSPFVDPVSGESTTDLDDFAASLPVLADGSQAMAVHDAMEGKTFVLQGPPGTGKSQTITNLLARALHSGKRVLFVAEKPDALAVVRDRLVKVGLGSFGLNLHDKGMRAADVRQQISDALGVTALPDATGFDAASRDIGRTITPLQRYPERLHNAGRLGESAYSARDKVLAIPVEDSLPVPASFISTASLEQVAQVRESFAQVRDLATSAGTARDNPWSIAHVGASGFAAELRDQFTQTVQEVRDAVARVQGAPAATQYLVSVESLEELIAAAPLATHQIDLALVDASVADAPTVGRKHVIDTIDSFSVEKLFPGVVPQTLDAPISDLRDAASTALKSFFIGRKKRVTAAAESVQGFLSAGSVLNKDSLIPTIAEMEKVQTLAKTYLDYVRQIPGVALPPTANLLRDEDREFIVTRVRRIDSDIVLTGQDGSPSKSRLRALVSAGPDASQAIGALAVALAELLPLLGTTADSVRLWLAGRSVGDVVIRSADAWHRDATERDFLQLRRWLALRDVLNSLEDAGLSEAADTVASGSVPAQDADMAFERGYLNGVLRRQLDDEGLDAFDGAQHDTFVRGYSAAAESLRRLSPGVLANDMIGSRGFDAGVTVGAVGELKRELGKQRRFKPIRRLLKEHWQVISRATPLVLAIPDALVRFVDGDLEPFDLVVFDEASQIRTAHAIGVLGRGRAAVIVGDDKQMPPTSVAQVRAETDETIDDEDGDDVEQESILTECIQARVPEISLTWHYRSEDESLIAFSNHEYYSSELSTFPAPSPRVGGKGLSFVRVDGRFVRTGRGAGDGAGTNPEEAAAIVKEIVRRLNDPEQSKFSIGVVTFNRPQQRLIQTMLVETEDPVVLKAIDKELTPEAVTIWNLETVQGSERDVMLFSVAFSKDSSGKLSRNFGPLNNVGGQRRLNVAVTRARRQLIVFCSFDPEDLRSEGLAEGLQHLERYLRIARDGFESDGALSTRRPSAPDRHRDEIVAALQARGLRAAANVGLSEFKVDIAVASSAPVGEWSVGILTDGPAWRARKTVSDRDSLPLSLLAERMGWPAVTRVWTPDWLRDSGAVLDHIVELVREVESGVRPARAKLEESEASPVAIVEAPSERPLPAAIAPPFKTTSQFEGVPRWTAWEVQDIQPAFILEQLFDRATQEYLHTVVADIIRVEGPVHADRAARHIGRLCGLERVREVRVAAIRDVLAPAFAVSNDGFYFMPDDGPEGYLKWSKSDDSVRNVDEISLVEISNAMADIARIGLGASREELINSAASAFGYRRVTSGIRERMERGADEGIRRGKLREEGGYLVSVG
ncbi:MAG: DUF3320 domain-containing protein [Cryobacterium sp.]|nr:DUF3320 domain-containing protein [Cryobacterium sp.]